MTKLVENPRVCIKEMCQSRAKDQIINNPWPCESPETLRWSSRMPRSIQGGYFRKKCTINWKRDSKQPDASFSFGGLWDNNGIKNSELCCDRRKHWSWTVHTDGHLWLILKYQIFTSYETMGRNLLVSVLRRWIIAQKNFVYWEVEINDYFLKQTIVNLNCHVLFLSPGSFDNYPRPLKTFNFLFQTIKSPNKMIRGKKLITKTLWWL